MKSFQNPSFSHALVQTHHSLKLRLRQSIVPSQEKKHLCRDILPENLRRNMNVYETGGTYLYLLGSGYFWLPMVLLSKIIQTFLLADFCYYYVKSVVNG